MKRLNLIILLCSVASLAFSQENIDDIIAVKEAKKLSAKLVAIKSVNEYASSSELKSEYSARKFQKKFDDKAVHVDDILLNNSSNYQELANRFQSLSFNEYYNKLETFLSDELISSYKVECEILDVNLDLSRTTFDVDKEKSKVALESAVVLVEANKIIKIVDRFNLNYNEKIPVIFELLINEDRFGRLKPTFLSIKLNKEKDFVPYDFAIFDLTGPYIPKECNYLFHEIVDQTDSHISYKYFEESSSIILSDKTQSRDELKVTFSESRNKNLVLNYNSDVTRKKAYCLTSQVNAYTISTKVQSSGINDEILNTSNATNEYSFDFVIQDIARKNDLYFGVTYLNQRTDLSLPQFSQTFELSDPDGFTYSRISTYSNIKETLHATSVGLKGGMLFSPKSESVIARVYVGGYLNPQIDYSYTSRVNHQGYYSDLYGVTIDENHIYDFGQYQPMGDGVLNSVGTQFDIGGCIILPINLRTFKTSGFNIEMHPSVGVVRRTMNFNNESNPRLELNATSNNSTTVFIDKINMTLFKVGITFCIRETPVEKPCP